MEGEEESRDNYIQGGQTNTQMDSLIVDSWVKEIEDRSILGGNDAWI